MCWQSQVTAYLLGLLVLALSLLKRLGSGKRKRRAAGTLEGRVTGAAISLPPQEDRGRAVTISPPARVPNQST